MVCKICNGSNINIIYDGKIRSGKFGVYTSKNVPIYQCSNCGIVWHENDSSVNYQDASYRNMMGEEDNLINFNLNHDSDVIEKLSYMGTGIFRDKVVMDIGCGGGSVLDYLAGVAKEIIGIEPTEGYRKALNGKGYTVFPYTDDVDAKYNEKVDVIFSFDVIEHVADPIKFINSTKRLLKDDGILIIGTPTIQPLMRKAVGETYDSFLFSVQHPWVFDRRSLSKCIEDAGFSDYEIKYKQRYGLSNLIGWIKEQKPVGNIKYDWIPESIGRMWKVEVENNGMADYIISYIRK